MLWTSGIKKKKKRFLKALNKYKATLSKVHPVIKCYIFFDRSKKKYSFLCIKKFKELRKQNRNLKTLSQGKKHVNKMTEKLFPGWKV